MKPLSISTSQKSSYRPDIDGLRAIAVMFVVVYHSFPSLLKAGFIGVDVFFVISGYLITSIIARSIVNNNFSFSNFYYRRISRIFPSLLLVLLFSLLLGWMVLLPYEYQQLSKHILFGSIFSSNFLLLSEINYFDISSDAKPMLHLWSLAIEEQYYIIWPFALYILSKVKPKFLLLTVIILTCASFLNNVYLVQKNISAAFYSPLARFWELSAGGLISLVGMRYYFSKNKITLVSNNILVVSNISSSLGLAFIFASAYLLSKKILFPGFWVIIPVIGTILIIISPSSWINKNFLSQPILVNLGLISFPLYLWHWPLLSILRIIENGAPSNFLLLLTVIVSIILAWLTYIIIERPLKFSNYSKIKSAYLLVGMSVIIASLGYYVYKQNGFPSRTTKYDNLIELYKKSPHLPLHNIACDNLDAQFAGFDSCVISKPTAPEVVILGDSHSHVLYNSLAQQLPNFSVMNIGKWHCLPFYSKNALSTYDCDKYSNVASNYISTQPTINSIYLTGFWNYLMVGLFQSEGFNSRTPSKPLKEDIDLFKASATKMLESFFKSNKRVILILDPPMLDFDIKSCLNFRPFQFSNSMRMPCGVSRLQYENTRLLFNSILQDLRISFPKLQIYDPASVFCNQSICSALNNGLPLYFDGDHLHALGAELLVNDMLKNYKPAK